VGIIDARIEYGNGHTMTCQSHVVQRRGADVGHSGGERSLVVNQGTQSTYPRQLGDLGQFGGIGRNHQCVVRLAHPRQFSATDGTDLRHQRVLLGLQNGHIGLPLGQRQVPAQTFGIGTNSHCQRRIGQAHGHLHGSSHLAHQRRKFAGLRCRQRQRRRINSDGGLGQGGALNREPGAQQQQRALGEGVMNHGVFSKVNWG